MSSAPGKYKPSFGAPAEPAKLPVGRPRREPSWKANYDEDLANLVDVSSNFQSGGGGAGGIFKSAAIEILKQEQRLMSTGEITKLAMERHLIRCQGKTPENTMASALYTDVRKRGGFSPFIKPKEGLFGLKSWLSEPWLTDWLKQENIQLPDFLPELAEGGAGGGSNSPPPHKRQRLAPSSAMHMGMGRPFFGGGGGNGSYRMNYSEDGDYSGETDSDDKSNLQLLLEAADEIDRQPGSASKPPPSRKAPGDKPRKYARTRDPLFDPSSNYYLGPQVASALPRLQAQVQVQSPTAYGSYNPGPLTSPALQGLQNLAMGLGSGGGAAATTPTPPATAPPPGANVLAALLNPAALAQLGSLAGGNGMGVEAQLATTALAAALQSALPAAMQQDLAARLNHGNSSTTNTHTNTSNSLQDALREAASKMVRPASASPAPPTPTPTATPQDILRELLKAVGNPAAAAAHAAAAAAATSPPAVRPIAPLPLIAAAPPAFPAPAAATPPAVPAADKTNAAGKNKDTEHMELDTSPVSDQDRSDSDGAKGAPQPKSQQAEAVEQQPKSAAQAPAQDQDADTTQQQDKGATAAEKDAIADGAEPMETSPTAAAGADETAAANGADAAAAAKSDAAPADDATTAAPTSAAAGGATSGSGLIPGILEPEQNAAAQQVLASLDAAASSLASRSEVVDSGKINLYRQHILFLERVLGNMHPQVGKAYVFLARVLQHEGSRWSLTMAQRALLRAWQILASMKTRESPSAPDSLENFSYLMGHLQECQTVQPWQQQVAGLQGLQQAAALQASQQLQTHKLAAQLVAVNQPSTAAQ